MDDTQFLIVRYGRMILRVALACLYILWHKKGVMPEKDVLAIMDDARHLIAEN